MKRISGSKPQRSMVWSWKTVWAACAGEGLEAALGVGEGQAHHGAGDGVEAAAEELAVEGLALGLAVAPPASESRWRYQRPLDGGKKAFSLLDGRREVGVGEEHHSAPRLEHPGAHAVTFAAVAGVLDQPDLGRGLGKGAHHLGGRVG